VLYNVKNVLIQLVIVHNVTVLQIGMQPLIVHAKLVIIMMVPMYVSNVLINVKLVLVQQLIVLAVKELVDLVLHQHVLVLMVILMMVLILIVFNVHILAKIVQVLHLVLLVLE